MRSLVSQDLAAHATPLRAHFDKRFAEPRKARGDRFVWDYWHVPGQYTALRTPAWEYFPKATYERWHRDLVAWGREHLGCHDISPPWLSVYVEGCRQELHGDLPHGPFAFVFSLTDWAARTFRGGETLLLRDSILDHWSDAALDPEHLGLEENGILETVDPELGRLLVFDPRIPHGVRRVEGTHDPRHGRVVMHGWFVQPRPFVSGPLPEDALGAAIQLVLERLPEQLPADVAPIGTLCVRFDVTAAGKVQNARILVDTLRVPGPQRAARDALVAWVLRTVRALQFPRQKRTSVATLPLVFE